MTAVKTSPMTDMKSPIPDTADGDALIPMVKKKMSHLAQGVKPHTRLDKKPGHLKMFGEVKGGGKK